VTIVDFEFTPATTTIRQHEAVTWRNDGSAAHTVTADDASFDSGELSTSDAFAHVFDVAGTFTYHCSIHPQMTGTVVVEPVAATEVPSGPTPPPGTLPPSFNVNVTPPPAATSPSTTPTQAPTPPGAPAPDSNTGQSSAPLIIGLLLVVVVLAGGAYAVFRRRQGR
jgi:hypothetical protein